MRTSNNAVRVERSHRPSIECQLKKIVAHEGIEFIMAHLFLIVPVSQMLQVIDDCLKDLAKDVIKKPKKPIKKKDANTILIESENPN